MTHLHIYAYSWYLRVNECQRCLEELEFHLLIMNIYEKLGMASLLWCVCISDQAITFGQNIGKICPLNSDCLIHGSHSFCNSPLRKVEVKRNIPI